MVITNPSLIATNFIRAVRVFENGDTVETVIVKDKNEGKTGLVIDNPSRLLYTYFLFQERMIALWYNNMRSVKLDPNDCVIESFVLDVINHNVWYSEVQIWKTKQQS